MSFLPLPFFNRPAPVVAQALLGQELAHTLPDGTILSGLITETEAYLNDGDAAAHAARGPTPATAALRMGPGTLYIHPMRQYVGLDVVTHGGSVLIRALQPLQGFPEPLPTLANGPGKLCRALGITRAHNGLNATHATCPVHFYPHTLLEGLAPLTTTRIGISKATHLPLRFHLNTPSVSRKKPI